jgi:hypothetical protein
MSITVQLRANNPAQAESESIKAGEVDMNNHYVKQMTAFNDYFSQRLTKPISDQVNTNWHIHFLPRNADRKSFDMNVYVDRKEDYKSITELVPKYLGRDYVIIPSFAGGYKDYK